MIIQNNHLTWAKIYLYTGSIMPRSSTSSLSPETIAELENQFFSFLNSLSYEEKKQFFNEFLTNEEKMMMYKRLALYWCLLEGYPLAKIQQMIGVTHDTTRVYNKKKNMLSSEFKELIKRISPAIAIQAQSPAPTTPSEDSYKEPETADLVEESPSDEPFNQPPSNTYEEPQMPESEPAQNLEDKPLEEKPFESIQTSPWEEQNIEPTNEQHETQQFEHREEVRQDENPEFKEEPEILHPFEAETQQPTDQQPQEQYTAQHGMSTSSEETQPAPSQQPQEEQKEKKKSGLAKFFGF